MPSPTPTSGRCGAQLSTGGYCVRAPVKGQKRCRRHGGSAAKSWVERLKINDEGRELITAALKDPGLMDVRRPLALAETVLARTALLPAESAVRRHAQRRIIAAVGPDLMRRLRQLAPNLEILAGIEELLEPTDDDLEEARMDLHERSMRLLSMYGKRQVEAVRALEWAKVVREQAVPLFGLLMIAIGGILKRHVPEDRQASAIEELRRAFNTTLAELAKLEATK